MATYVELSDLRGIAATDALRKKIAIACLVKANTLAGGTPTENQKAWAVSALQDPGKYSDALLNYIIAEYNTVATSAITDATDAQVQTAVNEAIDTLFGS